MVGIEGPAEQRLPQLAKQHAVYRWDLALLILDIKKFECWV